MKKSVLTFCAVLLLATQAPVANAKGVDAEVKAKVNYFQNNSQYRVNLNNAYLNIQLPFENIQFGDFESLLKPFPLPTPKPPQPETKPEEKPETKPETNPDVKPEEKPETKPENPSTPPGQVTTPETPNQPDNIVNDSDVAAIEKQVVELTNQERAKHGLNALQMDQPLMAAAREKSQDMQVNNYFSHTSPTFGSPFDRLKALGISYKLAGENIAKGQTSAAQVVEAWMNSEGHRANILNKDFTHIGVGYVKQGHVWTQQFIKK